MTTLQDFDLDAKPDDTPIDGGDDWQPGTPTIPPSPTALALDAWSIRQGERLAADAEFVNATGTQDPLAAADIRAAAYEPEPELVESCQDPLRHQFVQELLRTPDWQGLRASTIYDDETADLAAIHGAKQWVTLCQAREQAEQNNNPFDNEMASIKAAADATREARKDVSDYQDMKQGLGGGDGQKLDPKRTAELFKRVRGNHRLKRICELAGRYRRLAQAMQRRKSIHGQDDMVGIVQDGDLARLVPSELALLADADTELLAMRRIVERQAMCREYRGVEPVARGPIVVVVDESGSMDGEPIANAKAMALALAWIARAQRRWVAFQSFAAETDNDGNPCGIRLALPPDNWDDSSLLGWMEHFYDGNNTKPDVPLQTLPFTYWPKFERQGLTRGKTDIILITDACLRVPQDMAQRFNAWKLAEKARMVTLVLGKRQAGDLAGVSDEVHLVPCLDIEQAAVAEVLSV